MTCDEARELFSARVDEALASTDAARLDAHLTECAECRTSFAHFERTVSLVRGIPPAHAPAGFVDRVLEKARPVSWPRRVARRLFVPMGIKLPMEAAALVLVAGLAVMTFRQTPEMQRLENPVPALREAPAPTATPAPPATSAPLAPTPGTPAAPPAMSALPATPAKPAPPAPPVEARTQRSGALLSDRADRLEVAPAPPSNVAQERSRDAVAKSAAAPLAARAPAAPIVAAHLVATDRAAALASLSRALDRLGGREIARRTEGDGDVVDVAVPRDAYESFTRELGTLGVVTIERRPDDLPPSVTITIRITS
jgi:anti-sigma factor RsiW